MLSIPASTRTLPGFPQHGAPCIRCAYRAQLLLLEARRWKSGTPAPRRIRSNPRGRGYPSRSPLKMDFPRMLAARLKSVKEELRDAPILKYLQEEDKASAQQQKENENVGKVEPGNQAGSSENTSAKFVDVWDAFLKTIIPPKHDKETVERVTNPFDKPRGDAIEAGERARMIQDLRNAHELRGAVGLEDRIKYHFYAHVTNARFSKSDLLNQKGLADLRYPTEWFPATRQIHREIHLHVGPTNSGKTYQALQRLEKARTSVYAGPLRLLAHEVYSRMQAKGRRCNLITGEERRIDREGVDANSYMSACTVEMIPLNTTMDVCVIDEIQMIANRDRGWAWTQALLGVKAKELHLCGEERTVPLIKELCGSLGETVHVHRYQRLSPIAVADESLNMDFKQLRKGDCIVSFSVLSIHALRSDIEKATGRSVAIVYGSLPPETRTQQARLFNDPDNEYDFLVASDAIGMGLNLAIKRVIFESSMKSDGYKPRVLSIADIKQIGGRAGRYRVAPSSNQLTPPLAQTSSHTAAPDDRTSSRQVLNAAHSQHTDSPAPTTSVDTAINAEALV